MKTEDKLINEIGKYNELGSSSQDISQIMHFRNTITMLSFTYSKESGDMVKEYHTAVAKREADIYIKRLESNMKEWEANANAKPSKLEIAEKEGAYKASDKLLKASYKVVDEINQRVAYLRQELDKSRHSV